MISGGIQDRRLDDVPIAVVDTETTGLYPSGDRVIEIAVVRVDPGQAPRVVVDTLLNPGRRVTATEIHGITDADVAGAPTFEDVAPAIVDALHGSVFAAYNVYFDSKFLREELLRAGFLHFPPYLCLMYLRPMLGLGRKCSLLDACSTSGIQHGPSHNAAADALAASRLWSHYLKACTEAGVETFRELGELRQYKFTTSFASELLSASARLPTRPAVMMRPRGTSMPTLRPEVAAESQPDRQEVMAAYWDALTAAVADLDVTPHEVFYLQAKQRALGIRNDELRWLHARVVSGLLADMCQDKSISDEEVVALNNVVSALRDLGWAPGDGLW